MGRAKKRRGPRVNPFYHPYARARARSWSARCYGVARQRDGSRQKAPGSPACFLSAISGWFSLSILARGCRRIWRGELRFIGFGGATLLDRIGPPGRCSGGWPHDRNSWLMPRVNPPRVSLFYHPYARARARQWSARLLRGSSPTRWVAPKSAGILRRAFSPPNWRVGAEGSGAAN